MGVKLVSASGGSVEINPPTTASNFIATMPAVTGNVVVDSATQTLTNKTLTTPNIDSAQFATVTGTAPIYPCRAWVNFNGTGTVAIRSSGNVSSITDTNVGRYVVNFTTAMPDVNYSTVCGGGYTGSVQVFFELFEASSNLAGSTAVSAYDRGAGAYVDPQIFNVSVFR